MARQLSNLPAEVTSFVGRRHELREVKRLLTTSRLLTLTGTWPDQAAPEPVKVALYQQESIERHNH